MRLLQAAWVVAPFVVLAIHVKYLSFLNDDAYISFRYAANLVEHGELVYNLGARVEGYTNFLWTLLIAAGLAVGLSAEFWSRLLGLACAMATLCVVRRMCSTVDQMVRGELSAGGPTCARAWWGVGPLLLACASPFACWASGGMETMLFTLLIAAGVWRYWRERLARCDAANAFWSWSAVLFGLASLTRPEGHLIFGVTFVHFVADLALRRSPSSTTKAIHRLVWWAGIYAAIVVPHQIWRVWYYGDWLPNTYYAKVVGAHYGWRGWLYLRGFAGDCKPWLVVLLLVIPRRRPGGPAVGSFYIHLFAVICLMIAHVVRVGGDFMAMYRFFVPIVPLLAVLLADELRNLHDLIVAVRARHGAPAWNLHLVTAFVAAVMIGHFAMISYDQVDGTGGSGGGFDGLRFMDRFARQNAAVGRWLAEHSAEDDTIATTAAGALPYYAKRRTFDMHGLTEPAVARDNEQGRTRPGHAKVATPEQILEWRPTFYVGVPNVDTRPPEPSEIERARWEPHGYRWRTVQIPELGGAWWGCFHLDPAGANQPGGASPG